MIKNIFSVLLVLFFLFIVASCEKDPEIEVKEYIYLNVDSVNTTSVFLSWTQSHSDKFQSYQVYYSKKSGFLVSSGSLYKTITDRTITKAKVDTIFVPGQLTYFRVRLSKSDGIIFDTGEVSATPQ